MDALIPRDALFGNPDRIQARISPDGRWLAWLSPVGGVKNVFVAPADRLQDARAVTADAVRDIRMYEWARSSTRLLYIQDAGGDENWHVFSTDPVSGETVDLTPEAGVQAQLMFDSPDHPTRVVIGLNARQPQVHDWIAVDVETGERELLFENPGLVGGVFGFDLEPRLGVAMQPDGGLAVLGIPSLEPVLTIPAEDSLTTSPLVFGRDGALWMLDSRGRDTGALVRLDLTTGERTEVFADPQADLVDAWVHPQTHAIQAVVTAWGRRELVVLDPDVQVDVDRLAAFDDGEIQVVSRTADDQTWIIAYTRADGPVRYARYDRREGGIVDLFSSQPGLADLPLTAMHSVTLTARDGLPLPSYLSLPRWDDHDGRPSRPLPMVLLVHGGPWARDSWGLSPLHQIFANRGYAVLSVNFRGSTGFGKAFVNAGDFEWAGKMHDDLLDAVDWAVEQGIAQRDRVAIMGGSYGGYATLVGLTFTPEVFACGVDIVGPSNLVTLLETIPPYWTPMIAQFHNRMGTNETEEGRADLVARSPLSRVQAIVRPLLIGQGANDPRVKQSESDQIVAAMQERGIPVTYVLFPDEGHGFSGLANRLAFYALAEGFLAEHLGGRAQPVGDALAGSTAVVS
ncbi:MAG: S9 family peptidase [Alphaproteobacteria bacterium]|nr:S9 family peptidase [Alphaproteobacteria bacterium]MCB9691109.1 S9 family peptidase [Alphaproteobacteria bacterium]